MGQVMKRLTWFVVGAATGAAGANYAKRKVKETAASLSPGGVARTTADIARRASRELFDAIREGREAMQYREDELRARRDGRLRDLGDHLAPGDELLIDGRPVDVDRVVVLRRADVR